MVCLCYLLVSCYVASSPITCVASLWQQRHKTIVRLLFPANSSSLCVCELDLREQQQLTQKRRRLWWMEDLKMADPKHDLNSSPSPICFCWASSGPIQCIRSLSSPGMTLKLIEKIAGKCRKRLFTQETVRKGKSKIASPLLLLLPLKGYIHPPPLSTHMRMNTQSWGRKRARVFGHAAIFIRSQYLHT